MVHGSFNYMQIFSYIFCRKSITLKCGITLSCSTLLQQIQFFFHISINHIDVYVKIDKNPKRRKCHRLDTTHFTNRKKLVTFFKITKNHLFLFVQPQSLHTHIFLAYKYSIVVRWKQISGIFGIVNIFILATLPNVNKNHDTFVQYTRIRSKRFQFPIFFFLIYRISLTSSSCFYRVLDDNEMFVFFMFLLFKR